jgi:polar amino acid transport system substrate-binding protein
MASLLLLSLTRKQGIKIISIAFLVYIICTVNIAKVVSQQAPSLNPIRLGLRTAAFPIGNVVKEEIVDKKTNKVLRHGEYSGFCQDFAEQLERTLFKNHSKRPVVITQIENQYRGIGYPRFDGLLKSTIDIECGPNSISSLDLKDKKGNKFSESIEFSNKSFYESNIKLLLKKEVANKLN